MLDACVLTIARNSDDYLELCIRAVAPYVKRVRITVDSRSTDRTWSVAKRLREEFLNVEVNWFPVKQPSTDLVAMRNSQLGFPEKWGVIVDSDELHPFIDELRPLDADSYALQCWAVWNATLAHKQSSQSKIGRIFKNYPDLEWRGPFNKETLFNGKKRVFEDAILLPYRYIHFTHIKKDSWRAEMNKTRVADSRSLTPMPEDIIRIIQRTCEKVPNVRFREAEGKSSRYGKEPTREFVT